MHRAEMDNGIPINEYQPLNSIKLNGELNSLINTSSNILLSFCTTFGLFDCIFNCVLTFSVPYYLLYAVYNGILMLFWTRYFKQIIISQETVCNYNNVIQNYHKRAGLLISFNLVINLLFIITRCFILKSVFSVIISCLFIIINSWFIHIYNKLIPISFKGHNAELQYQIKEIKEIKEIKRQIRIMNENSQSLLTYLSPKAILNSTIEKFNSSSITIPTPYISALNTINGHIFYLNHQLIKHIDGKFDYSDNDEITTFDLGSLIQNIMDILSGISNNKNIEISIYYKKNIFLTKFLGYKERIIRLLLFSLGYILEETDNDIYCNLELVKNIYNVVFIVSFFILGHNFDEFMERSNKLSEMINGIAELEIEENKIQFKISLTLHPIGGQIMDEFIFTPTSEYELNPNYLNVSEKNSQIEMNDSVNMINSIVNHNIEIYSLEHSKFCLILTTLLKSWDIHVSNHIIYDISKVTTQTPNLLNNTKNSTNTPGQSSISSNSDIKPTSYFKSNGIYSTPTTNELQRVDIDRFISSCNKTIIINDHMPTLSRLLVSIANDASSPYNSERILTSSPCNVSLLIYVSLSNYKGLIKSITSIINTPSSFSYPLVIIVPKPAGPKRILSSVYYSLFNSGVEFPYIPNVVLQGLDIYLGDKRRDNSNFVDITRANTGKRTIQSTNNNDKSSNKHSPTATGLLSRSISTKHRSNLVTITQTSAPESTSEDISVDLSKDTKNSKEKRSKKAPIKLLKDSKKTLFTDQSFPPIKILIVEDNPINLTITTNFMKKRKIEHFTATNGREAVDMFSNQIFHFILMDIQLPVMSGIEATKEIRLIEKANKTCYANHMKKYGPNVNYEGIVPSPSPVIIIALTASSLISDRDDALMAGCNDFLTKPLSYVWLEKKIIEWGSMQALILSGFPILDSKKLETRKQKVAFSKKSNNKKQLKIKNVENTTYIIRDPVSIPVANPHHYLPNSQSIVDHIEVKPVLMVSPSDEVNPIPDDTKKLY